MNKQDFNNIIDKLSNDCYDIDLMIIDFNNGNFEESRLYEYEHETIVQNSLINGQFTQAKRQCDEYGLSYASQYSKFKNMS